ncbi:MAG: hypothetical protein O7D91_03220 [Planctomycetota bacterium]|nr:hypothetical protein [Planctomycetota bacterium]
MAHESTRDALITIANDNNGDALGFLEAFSPIHRNWHGRERTYGFLLFHHRVVRYFMAIVNPRIGAPVEPFTTAEFAAMGVNPYAENPENTASLSDLAAYSADIQRWHNGAHASIQVATGVPMMNAAENIFYRVFWQLHLFIDEKFKVRLGQYEAEVHPNAFLNVSAIAAHIEVSHHAWVPRI